MSFSAVRTSVFADGSNGGNPCPVVLDAGSLTAEQMRSLAAAWNQESVFVRDLDASENRVRIRFFVPNHEMEMCGHGMIACIAVLVERGLLDYGDIRVETELGPVVASCRERDGTLRVSLDQFRPSFADTNPPKDAVARVLNVSVDEIATELGPIRSVSTSRHKLLVPLRNAAILDQLAPDFEALWDLCDEYETTGFYPFAVSEDDEIDVEARQFPSRAGYVEDPATGVAACALAAYLTNYEVFDPKGEGERTVRIAQGRAMGKPSLLRSRVEVTNGTISTTRVIGSADIEREETVTVK
ncbi:PhzF family phenazine biosynthesis protein [Haladaptatus sp. DYF46]|uniref:PhzF family phenazine biosynthesis protein n=1 Tax=Haladaptatus sp. DYF46 TaxID=2886041 RepID=UPI001E4CB4F3|nr:PhzF family phenazine biosynthesis protein [Haladaptatus sp. DYF46]